MAGNTAMRQPTGFESAPNALLDELPILIWRSGRDARCDYFNKAWLEFTGRRLKQELGDGWVEGVHPEDRARCVRDYLRAFKARRPFVLEYRLRHRGGDYCWIRDLGQPLFERDGEFLGYLGGCLDFTQHRHADEIAREMQMQLLSFMNHSPSVTFIKDLEGRYLNVNRQFLLQFGLTEQQVIGKADREVFSAEQAAEFIANDKRVVDKNAPIDVEETAQYIDGPRTSVVSKFPILDAEGVIAAVGGIATDITELKRSEASLRQALEERESLSRDLHDNIIQTVYAVGMSLEECRRIARDGPKQVSRRIAHAIDSLNDVIRDVRQYISDGVPKPINGAGLRAKLGRMAARIERTGKLRYRLDVDARAVRRVSRHRAQHVLQIAREALSNSLRHSHGKWGLLTLRCVHDGVRLVVSDDGKGFAPSKAARHDRGLSNMKFRARQIGAKLEIISSLGRGTSIVVHIPKRG